MPGPGVLSRPRGSDVFIRILYFAPSCPKDLFAWWLYAPGPGDPSFFTTSLTPLLAATFQPLFFLAAIPGCSL